MSLVAVLAAMACSDPEASNVGSPEPASPVVSDSSRDSAGAANRVTTFAPKPIDPELVKALEEPSVIERDDAKPFNPSVIRMKDNEATMAQEILDLPESDGDVIPSAPRAHTAPPAAAPAAVAAAAPPRHTAPAAAGH